jgi:hypothetical protein
MTQIAEVGAVRRVFSARMPTLARASVVAALALFVAADAALAATVALAGKSQAEGTAEQRWACEQDAVKFCGTEIPNVPLITACMIKNVKKLSPTCRAQFKQTD